MSGYTDPPDWVIRVPNARTRPVTGSYPTISQTQMDTFQQWNENVAGKDELAAGAVPVAGSSVSGSVRTNSVGVAPASSVAVQDTNMLVSQDFSNAYTVVAAGQWSWDGTDGHITNGCARVDCNGYQDDLVSNEILVVAGENIEVTVWVKWIGLSYTGSNPIVLGVEKYRKGKDPDSGGTVYLDVGGIDIEALASPAASGDWTKLTGTYIVPDKNVDQLRFRFSAAQTATDGIVLWDEAEFKKLDLIPDDAVPGVGQTVDNVVNNLYGREGSNFGQDDVAVALANTSAAVTSLSSRVASLEASGHGAAIAGDDFLFSGEIVASANWGGSYDSIGTGTYVADGHNAVFNQGAWAGGVAACRFDWQGADTVSETDYQLVQVILGSAPGSYTGGYAAGLSLYGRISSDWQNYMQLDIAANGHFYIYRCVSGTRTQVATGPCPVPGAGSTVSFYLGDFATTQPRRFSVEVNGALAGSYTEVGTTSMVGASYRKWGWGGWNTQIYVFLAGPIFLNPPVIDQWLGMDQ